MHKKITFLITNIFLLLVLFFPPALAAEPTVTADTSWLSSLVSPDSYFHVRDGDITKISPEDYINRYRRALGLTELRISEALRQSAKNHTDYQNKNGVYNGDPHGENPAAVGFTGVTPSDRCQHAGYNSYCGEVQAGGDGDLTSALDGFMMTPFHRLGLIGPGATEIGCAQTGGWVTCDIGYNLYSGYSSDFDGSQPIVYPANGQVISTTFPVFESPMPYPQYAGQRIGSTLMFWLSESSEPLEAEAAIYDLTEQKSIDSIISIDTDNWYTMNAVFFNPVEPLELDHEYAAYVHDTSGANAFSKVWTFKTQKSSNVDFPLDHEVITYDANVNWAGSTTERLVTTPDPTLSQTIDRLSGYIMLAVDNHGEAWYVDPISRYRYYLKDGPTAYEFLRSFGLGITNADLAKIPIEADAVGGGSLAEQLSGRILLQVQEHGEAWYINPSDLKRYYLKDGAEAYRIMRELSLGTLMSSIVGINVGNCLGL
ncbi:MAG: CAP domain-containing protein [Candidatus Uhrbacteria bacterium]